MFIFDNVCDISLIETYKIKIQMHYEKMLAEGNPPMSWYPTRNIRIKNDPIVNIIQEFLQSRIKMTTECADCELQTWPIDSFSPLHDHADPFFNRQSGDYNSILYLNEDFEGGEFFTGDGILIKPKCNRLTFFNGNVVKHGLRKVKKTHRHGIIFWWKNTKFQAS